MKQIMQNNIIGVIMLGVFAALSIWVWLPSAAPPVPMMASTESNLTDRLEANQNRLADLIDVTTNRPLFDATRQAQSAPEQPAPAPPPEPVLSLVGILGVDEERVALVRVSTSAQLYRLTEGATLGPWQVIEISTNGISVSKDGAAPDRLVIDQ